MTPLLKYITPQTLIHGSLVTISDSTNWAINEAIIKTINVATSSTDWNLFIFCDTDYSSGMFGSIRIGSNMSGYQTIFLDLPYIDNEGSNSVHFYFNDNALSSATAIVEVYGQKAGLS